MTPKEVRQLWTSKLRSDEYKQATGQLHDITGGYCCLGVLCDLAVKEGIVEENNRSYVGSSTYRNVADLPEDVVLWAGLCDTIGTYKKGSVPSSLAEQNDTFRKTFSEIADIIDSEPEGLVCS